MTTRFDFLGTHINATNLDEVVEFLRTRPKSDANYVCFPDTYVIRESRSNPNLNKILNNSLLTLPDGKPSQWFANLSGFKKVSTVSGFALVNELLKTDKTHFFYGANESEIQLLRMQLEVKHPKARILGFASPPFIAIAEIENNEQIKEDLLRINELSPDFIWIGISSPKQDYLMQSAVNVLQAGTLLGVGGVFNYLIDPSKKSPEWVKRIGLRWLYRAVMEPKRLARKYLTMLSFLLIRAPELVACLIKRRFQRS